VLVGNFLLWGESVPRLFANKKRPSLTNFSEIWGLSRLEPTDPPTGQCALPGPGVWHRTFTTANWSHVCQQTIHRTFAATNWSPRTSWTRRLAPNLACHQLVNAPFLDPTLPSNLRCHQLVNAPSLNPTFGTEPSLPPTGQCALSESFPGTEPSLPPTGQCALSESYVWHRTLPVTNSSHVCQLVNARPYWIIL
jgi:hypothetical protein